LKKREELGKQSKNKERARIIQKSFYHNSTCFPSSSLFLNTSCCSSSSILLEFSWNSYISSSARKVVNTIPLHRGPYKLSSSAQSGWSCPRPCFHSPCGRSRRGATRRHRRRDLHIAPLHCIHKHTSKRSCREPVFLASALNPQNSSCSTSRAVFHIAFGRAPQKSESRSHLGALPNRHYV
jgi:hypothetical protein